MIDINGYERRTKQKKEKIHRAVLELLQTYSPEKVSIQDIARKAGVAPASIYNYFGSKEGLLKEVVRNLLEKNWRRRKTLWEADRPFPELLKQTLLMKDDFFNNVNLDALRTLIETDPDIKKIVDEYENIKYPQIARQFVEKGRREGYLRSGLSTESVIIYLKMYQFILKQPDMLKSEKKHVINDLCELMLYGIIDRPLPEETE